MKEHKFKTWFPADPATFQAAHMTEPWTIEDVALNYDGGECMHFGTEADDRNDNNNLIGLISFADKIKNYKNRNYIKRQYTGFKDKNGIEIYDGDIFKDVLGKSCVVFFSESRGCWEYKNKVAEGLDLYTECNPEYVDWELPEIIGNIYENPELVDGSIRDGDSERV